MNKRIIISLSVIGAIAAIAIGGTIAYFSDTETSTGNTFTAGTLDLRIDLDGDWQNPWTGPFFAVEDMKPGDQIEKTISLHVDNDAWLCIKTDNIKTPENNCVEPETNDPEDPDTSCGENDGELQNYLEVLTWVDDGQYDGWQCSDKGPACGADEYEGDNVYQAGWEEIVYEGPVATSPTGWEGPMGPLEASTVYYIGEKFCVGEIDPETFTCDGSGVGNIIQSDGYSLDIGFYAEQYKNNPGFSCPTE